MRHVSKGDCSNNCVHITLCKMRDKDKESKLSVSSDMEARMRAHLKSKKPVLGKDSPFSELLQNMVNTMLDGEMDSFQEDQLQEGRKNKRNGKSHKRVTTGFGEIDVSTPRDRNGEFEPELIGKRERTLSSGLDSQILALYAQGNSVEDVRRLLVEMYGVEISAGKISTITDKVLPEIEQWRRRELEPFYCVVYLDAIHFKVRRDGRYSNCAFYTAYSIDWHGQRDLLGLYVQAAEGASRWGLVLEDLRRRGVENILLVCVDDLKGFSNVISEVYPKAIVQKCVVHQVRNSLKYVDDKDRKKVASALRKVYTSATRESAVNQLTVFAQQWAQKYEYIVKQWEQNWEELMAFMDFSKEMRRMVYTTNPVEALHRIMRKIIKSKAAWVSETALMKQLYLSLKYNEKSWKKRARGWPSIQRDILMKYPDMVP